MKLKIEMILARLDLSDVKQHLRQVPLPSPEVMELEEMEILSPPAVLLHEDLTEFGTNIRRMISWRTESKKKSNLQMLIGQREFYFLVPAKHLKHSCVVCDRPILIYSSFVEMVDGGKVCPPCHLRKVWMEEGRSQKDAFEASERQFEKMRRVLARGETVGPISPSWFDIREQMARKYASQRETSFLKKWTSQDVAWWTSERQKSLDAARKKDDSSTSAP